MRVLLGDGSGDDQTRTWTARLLAQPADAWLVGLVGAVIIGVGAHQLYMGVSGRFRERLRLSHMRALERSMALRTGQLGLSARGVAFALIGAFPSQAAVQGDPGEARGLGAALAELARRPHGPWLLGAVAMASRPTGATAGWRRATAACCAPF